MTKRARIASAFLQSTTNCLRIHKTSSSVSMSAGATSEAAQTQHNTGGLETSGVILLLGPHRQDALEVRLAQIKSQLATGSRDLFRISVVLGQPDVVIGTASVTGHGS
jgi:hypothetical protein